MSGIQFYPDTQSTIVLFVLCLIGLSSGSAVAGPVSETGSGQVVFQSGAGIQSRAVHLRSKVEVQLSGMVSRVVMTQQFVNQTDEWQEATYLLPLPADAAVAEMEIEAGDRRIRGEIREKLQARKIYETAKQEGRRAGLTEQAGSDLFRQTVANIAPGETINIRLGYVHVADYVDHQFSIRLPLTFTPRFDPAGAEAGPMTSFMTSSGTTARDTSEETVNPVSIRINLDAGFPLAQIESPYHDIAVHGQGGRYEISLVQGEVPMDRDFLLRWRPETGEAPEAAVFSEQIAGEAYTLVMMMPPKDSAELATLPRDVIFVIDTSGSMQGTSIVQARTGLLKALEKLRPEDHFNIIAFNTGWRRLFDSPQPVDAFYLHQAREWVSKLAADGGTEMLPALRVAMEEPVSPYALKHIVFITDGAVGSEDLLFREISRDIGDAHLYPVGIGSAPNTRFMQQAALHGRGSYVHIGDPGEIVSSIGALFRRIDRPLVAGIRLDWPGAVEQYPRQMPALYDGEPVVVVGKGAGLSGSLEISGVTAGSPWRRSLDLTTRSQHEGIGSLWGRRKIDALDWSGVMGAPPEQVRQAIIDVALTHHLVSRHTSLVAVEEFISRLDTESLSLSTVSNLLPQGQAMYPVTGTHAGLAVRAGLILLLLAAATALVEFVQRVRAFQ